MARLGSMPTIPEEYFDDVVATTWSLPTEPKPMVPERRGGRDTLRDLDWDTPIARLVRHVTHVSSKTSLAVVREVFRRSPRTRVIAVTDENLCPLGSISPRDLVQAELVLPFDVESVTALDAAAEVGMSLPETTSLRAAARVLLEREADFLLAVDEAGRLAGAILSTDLLLAVRG